MSELSIVAFGIPRPQGSKAPGVSKSGKPFVREDNPNTKTWRQDVLYAAREARQDVDHETFLGPLSVDVTFTMPKPKSAPKTRTTYPDKQPDCDKLCRAVLDALQEAGVMRDDAQVVSLYATKAYPNEHPGALDAPGARINIRTYDGVAWTA